MAKYDGLIIPRSYSEYLNKTDGATLSQMLDSIGGTFDAAPTANSVKPARSGGIFAANAVITSDNATLTGVTISAGSVVRVLFTAALTGSDATTGLTLTYNGNAYAVKVGKDGALANFNAYEVESGVFKYLQAYTTLELMFDGTQFIIIGNPVVLSSADYTIYPDGAITYTKDNINKTRVEKIYSVWNTTKSVDIPAGVSLVTFNGAWYNKDVNNYLVALCRRGANNNVDVNILASNGYTHTVSGTVISVNSSGDAVQTNIVLLSH